jgi:hypothetical protein
MNEGQSIDDIDGRPADGQLQLHMAQHYSTVPMSELIRASEWRERS